MYNAERSMQSLPGSTVVFFSSEIRMMLDWLTNREGCEDFAEMTRFRLQKDGRPLEPLELPVPDQRCF